MASETSGRAKLGTAIALIGGAVGTGIIIYALLGDQRAALNGPEPADVNVQGNPVTETPAATPVVETPETEAVASKPESQSQADSENAPATEADPINENVRKDETPSDYVEDSQVATNNASSASEGNSTAQTNADSADNTEQTATNQKAEPSQTADTSEQTQVENTNTTEPTETVSDPAPEPQTEIASVAVPTTQTTEQPEQDTSTSSDAPIVEAEDPVMPAAEPVILQATPEATDAGPELDPNDPSVPKFDLVRIEADGSAVVAGRAAPNAEVQILSNGEEIGTAKASARGEFVALIDTELTTTAQSLALVANAPSTGPVTSQSNVIVLARSATEIDNLDEEISLAPAIVQATPDAVRVIQPVVGLADLDRVSLDTISYDQAGQVILAGRGRPGFSARIYADGKAISDKTISGSGTWSATINDLDEGRYVIRVDELDSEGKVASRVESPFQRIFPTSEQLALLTDATSVIVQPGNNLWTIAEGRYGEGFRYTTIFEANKEQIRDPDLIYPGQVFELPEGEAQQ